MKKIYTLVILMMSIGAVGCSSVQDDEINIEDASASEAVEPVAAVASTDEVPALDAPADVPPPAEAEIAEVPTAPTEEPAAPAEPVIADVAEAQPNTPAELPVEEAPLADAAPIAPVIEEPAAPAEPIVQTAAPEQTSFDGQPYQVKRGDTLMKIAFEHYGDLYRWREIYEANRAKIQDPNAVPPGTQLTLNGAGMVTIEKNGDHYLIKNGDTLGSISHDLYGTKKRWKDLWENNRQMIKDPNRIYAGFYLFYRPASRMTGHGESGKEPASL